VGALNIPERRRVIDTSFWVLNSHRAALERSARAL
jgi:hypothetical protein